MNSARKARPSRNRRQRLGGVAGRLYTFSPFSPLDPLNATLMLCRISLPLVCTPPFLFAPSFGRRSSSPCAPHQPTHLLLAENMIASVKPAGMGPAFQRAALRCNALSRAALQRVDSAGQRVAAQRSPTRWTGRCGVSLVDGAGPRFRLRQVVVELSGDLLHLNQAHRKRSR